MGLNRTVIHPSCFFSVGPGRSASLQSSFSGTQGPTYLPLVEYKESCQSSTLSNFSGSMGSTSLPTLIHLMESERYVIHPFSLPWTAVILLSMSSVTQKYVILPTVYIQWDTGSSASQPVLCFHSVGHREICQFDNLLLV